MTDRYTTKRYRKLLWLYRYICRNTHEVEKKNLTKEQLEKEINTLLIKYDCEPLVN